MNDKSACQHCDGYWMQTERGMRRCTFCPKGISLAAADEARKNPPLARPDPKLTEEEATVLVAMLAAIKMFPSDSTVRGMIGEELQQICQDFRDGVWLVKRMVGLFPEWPSIMALRIVYCNSKIPHDGVIATGILSEFPDGVPSERPQLRPVLALPAGSRNTAVPELEAAIGALARTKGMRKVGSR